MARHPQITRSDLTPLLMAGPASAAEMAARLQVNRTTVVRALARMGDEIVSMGATHRARYALRRAIRNAGNHWPIYTIDEAGKPHQWAELEALHERRWRIRWHGKTPDWASHFSDPVGLWEEFPFFLAGMQPQGYLGRAITRHISHALGLPQDSRAWSDEHTLDYLQSASDDLTGNIVVGDGCLRRALAKEIFPEPDGLVAELDRGTRYPELAQAVANSLPGSSAGGEQPKFLTVISGPTGVRHPVLVKFSPDMDQAPGRRWADLLLCEHHAHLTLAEVGLAVPGARILDAGGRRFLEIPRFDRTPQAGRRGIVSLDAIHPEPIGYDNGGWPQAAEEMRRAGLLEHGALETIRTLHAFGELIGNTDMHAGNLSFWLDDALPLRVAPAYDMLPMLWAPGQQGEIVARRFSPAPPLPASITAWREAASLASGFWDRVTAEPRLSGNFQEIAKSAAATLTQLRSHVG